MLENEKALALLTQYKEQGSRRALNDLVILHQHIVGNCARKYFTSLQRHPIIELDDLISAANIGLLKAAESFNPEKGSVFKYYAIKAMKQSIMHFILNSMNTIKSPHHKMQSDHKIYKLIEQLEGELKHEITQEDIEDSDLFTKNEIEHYYNKTTAERMPNYFDAANEEEEQDGNEEQLDKIRKCLPHLTSIEQLVLKHYFSLDDVQHISLTEFGKKLGRNKQQIWQIKERAINKIKGIIHPK